VRDPRPALPPGKPRTCFPRLIIGRGGQLGAGRGTLAGLRGLPSALAIPEPLSVAFYASNG